MSEKKNVKDYEELQFKDDFMFGKVMEDPVLCHDVLECLLERPIGELKEVQTQKQYSFTADGKPIRLDVYNEDDDGAVYDTEMQNLNNRSVESHMLPKRARYYQAAIDTDYMHKGYSYKRLPESTVMFICTFDPFRLGLGKYSFIEKCEESDIKLDDGTRKIFYNCCYKGEDVPKDIKEFYDYIMTGKAENNLTKRIDEAVIQARRNEVWRSQYMKEWVLIQDAKDEGREEGIELGREEGIELGIERGVESEQTNRIADMLRRNKTVEEIAEFCGYPVELIEKVQKSMLVND